MSNEEKKDQDFIKFEGVLSDKEVREVLKDKFGVEPESAYKEGEECPRVDCNCRHGICLRAVIEACEPENNEPVSAPSESQEEMWNEVVSEIKFVINVYVEEYTDSSHEQRKREIEAIKKELSERFKITRNP